MISKGGNAIDASIATILCDGVLCPHQMGVGGGFIMSFYNATTKKIMSINARETAPAAATTNMFVKDPDSSINGMYYEYKTYKWACMWYHIGENGWDLGLWRA